MADKNLHQKLAFSFLGEIRSALEDRYTKRELEAAQSYSLKTFGIDTIKPKMQIYNDNPEMIVDKTDEVFQKMVDLKENMIENIENLIQRDGKIEIIAEKALNLSVVSNSFAKKSKKLKEQERRKRYMQIAIVAILVIAVVSWILYAIFGGGDDNSGTTP